MAIELTVAQKIQAENGNFKPDFNIRDVSVPTAPTDGDYTLANRVKWMAGVSGALAGVAGILTAALGASAVIALVVSTCGIALVAIALAAAVYQYATLREDKEKHDKMTALTNNYQVLLEHAENKDIEEQNKVAMEARKGYIRSTFDYIGSWVDLF